MLAWMKINLPENPVSIAKNLEFELLTLVTLKL